MLHLYFHLLVLLSPVCFKIWIGSHWVNTRMSSESLMTFACRNSDSKILSTSNICKCDYIHGESYGQPQHGEAKSWHTVCDLQNLLTLGLLLLYVIGSKVFPLIFSNPSVYFQYNLHLQAAKWI